MSGFRLSWKPICLLLLFICLLFIFAGGTNAELDVHFVNPDGAETPVVGTEVVVTRDDRLLGLMYRQELAENEGMLFVFPKEAPRSFWMKNTYVELDIIYIGSNLKVVSVQARAKPLSLEKRPSKLPALYVVEVVGGMAEKWGVKKGSKLVVDGKLPKALN